MEIGGITFDPADVKNAYSDYHLDGTYDVIIILKNDVAITKTVGDKKIADDILSEIRASKPTAITNGVSIAGDVLKTPEYSIGLEKINALYDDNFNTYILTDNERREVTSTLNAIDGKMAERIAPHVAQLTEIGNIFVNKDKITGFKVGAKSDKNSHTVYVEIGKYVLPVSFTHTLQGALQKCYELKKKYEVQK